MNKKVAARMNIEFKDNRSRIKQELPLADRDCSRGNIEKIMTGFLENYALDGSERHSLERIAKIAKTPAVLRIAVEGAEECDWKGGALSGLAKIAEYTNSEEAVVETAIALVRLNAICKGKVKKACIIGRQGEDRPSDIFIRYLCLAAETRASAEMVIGIAKAFQNRRILESLEYHLRMRDLAYAKEKSGGFTEKDELVIRQNCRCCINDIIGIIELEAETLGLASKIINEFGIRHFTRYSNEVLKAVYDGAVKTAEGKPIFVIACGAADWNGSMIDMDKLVIKQKTIDECFAESDRRMPLDGLNIKFVESGKWREMTRLFFGITKNYGKISVAMLTTHGNEFIISIGEGKTSADILGGADISRFFSEKATIIVDACQAGIDNGIVQKASSKYKDILFYAPKKPTRIIGLNYLGTTSEGRFVFGITYQDRDAGAMFLGGEPITQEQLYKLGELNNASG